MTLEEIAAAADRALKALGDLDAVPRLQWGRVSQVSPIQVTLAGDTVPLDVAHSAVGLPILGAECFAYQEGRDRWLVAQRTTPAAAITNASGSTINVASFTSSGYSKSGFTSQDTQLVAYSEDVIADAVNSNTARVAALETKLNAVLAALRAAGIIAA